MSTPKRYIVQRYIEFCSKDYNQWTWLDQIPSLTGPGFWVRLCAGQRVTVRVWESICPVKSPFKCGNKVTVCLCGSMCVHSWQKTNDSARGKTLATPLLVSSQTHSYSCNFFVKKKKKKSTFHVMSVFAMCRFNPHLLNLWFSSIPIVINSSISGWLMSFIRSRWWLISNSTEHVTALFWLSHFFHALNLLSTKR